MRQGPVRRRAQHPRYVAPLLLVRGDEVSVPGTEEPVMFARLLARWPCEVQGHHALCTALSLDGGHEVHADPESLLWCRPGVPA